jgi:phage protein D
MNLVADFLKPRLTQSHTTIVVPLDKRFIFVRSHNRSKTSCRLSEVAQTHNAIPGIQFQVGSERLDQRWSLGSVCLSRCSSVR